METPSLQSPLDTAGEALFPCYTRVAGCSRPASRSLHWKASVSLRSLLHISPRARVRTLLFAGQAGACSDESAQVLRGLTRTHSLMWVG